MPDVPSLVSTAIFLVLITAVNLISVKAYGECECEFWFAIVKVLAIIALIGLGAAIILFGVGTGGEGVGITNLRAHGGFFPNGIWGMLTALVVVTFAFGGVEMIGMQGLPLPDLRSAHRRQFQLVDGRHRPDEVPQATRRSRGGEAACRIKTTTARGE